MYLWMDVSDFNYEGETVMMAPASGFYATEGKGKNEVRIAYVLNSIDLNKAIKCLEEELKAYKELWGLKFECWIILLSHHLIS